MGVCGWNEWGVRPSASGGREDSRELRAAVCVARLDSNTARRVQSKIRRISRRVEVGQRVSSRVRRRERWIQHTAAGHRPAGTHMATRNRTSRSLRGRRLGESCLPSSSLCTLHAGCVHRSGRKLLSQASPSLPASQSPSSQFRVAHREIGSSRRPAKANVPSHAGPEVSSLRRNRTKHIPTCRLPTPARRFLTSTSSLHPPSPASPA